MIKHVSNKIQNAIQMELFKAKESIKIAVAWFTNELLLQPLILKLQNGVSVELILNDDEINRGGESSLDFTEFLQDGGILRWNNSKQLMHDKFCIIDERVVITGSYNWTNKAEYNNESITVFYDEKETVDFYNDNYHKITNNIPYENGGKVENADKLAKTQKTIHQHLYDKVSQGGKYSEDYSILLEAPDVREFKLSQLTTEINAQAFSSCKHLEIIDLASVHKIGRSAFYRCELLQQITIPNTVKEIGDFAFQNCTSLRRISIPNSIEKIGDGAFYECSSLTTISISDSITAIGSSTFKGCSSLRQITIPYSVKEIGSSAFEGCSSLQEIVIPDSVKTIGYGAFMGCTSLRRVAISYHVTNIDIESCAFQDCTSLRQVELPDFAVAMHIGKGAFGNCSSLQEIRIPSSTKTINRNVFQGCTSLEQISIPDNLVTTGTTTIPCYFPLIKIIVRHMIKERNSFERTYATKSKINKMRASWLYQIDGGKIMTLEEKNKTDFLNKEIESRYYFSEPRLIGMSPELITLNDEEIITIPNGYQIFRKQIRKYHYARSGMLQIQEIDKDAPMVEYINVVTNTGHIVEFYPLVLLSTKAIEVDENGKYIRENGRIKIHRRTDDITRFIDSIGDNMYNLNNIIQAMAGCQIKYHFVKCLRIRHWGISESEANKNDVGMYILAEWSFVGDKRPVIHKEGITKQEELSDTSSYANKEFDALKSKFKYKIEIKND